MGCRSAAVECGEVGDGDGDLDPTAKPVLFDSVVFRSVPKSLEK